MPGPKKKSSAIRVFISYSHDTPDHVNAVLALGNELRVSGLDAWLDKYEDFPPQGWITWMRNQIRDADFVIVVCTREYKKRFEGRAARGQGKGAKFEGAIITHELYDREMHNKKFVPVVLQSSDAKYRPTPLEPYSFFDLSSETGRDQLYAVLTGQPTVVPQPIGELGRFVRTAPPQPLAPTLAENKSKGRLTSRVYLSTDARGTTVHVDIANVSGLPVFLETVELGVVDTQRTATVASSADERESYAATLVTLLPTKRFSGPIAPTERRTYFLAHEQIEFLADEQKRNSGRPFISVKSGAGEELRIDDASTESMILELLARDPLPFVDAGTDDRESPPLLRMNRVMTIFEKVMRRPDDSSFDVYPPRILLEDPSITGSDSVVEKLRDQPFVVELRDGTRDRFSFLEILALTQQIITVSLQLQQFGKQFPEQGKGPIGLRLQTTTDARELARPEMAKLLLAKIGFATRAAEDVLQGG